MEILIVDNSQMISARLETMISVAISTAIIYQATSYKEAIKFFAEKKIGVLVLDTGLPLNGSVNLLQEIKAKNIQTAVIILSIRIDTLTRQKFAAAGADFFFDKYHEFEKITGVINSIAIDRD